MKEGHMGAMGSAAVSFLAISGSAIGGAVKTFGSGIGSFMSFMSTRKR